MKPKKPVVIVLGPARTAVSGVATHVNLLFGSRLAQAFKLDHFQVGSEGRSEGAAARLLRLLTAPFALAVRILDRGAAIVHLNTSLNPRAYWRDLAYLLVAKLCGTRVVYQIHGGDLPQQFAAGSDILGAWLRRSLMAPDIVVVLAQSELAAYREFVPYQLIVALPNGIDPAPYARLVRRRDDLAPLRLLYVGRLVGGKGLDEALAGLAQARAAGIAASLVVAGSGPELARLTALAAELGIAADVRFVGPVFDAAKLAYYGAADLLLLPTYAEGLPYALLEAMAAGVPAITTRVGAIPDVMVDGVHGIFVPPGDAPAIGGAICHLAADRELLARMGAACRHRIAHNYSMERLADDFHRLYWDLAANFRADLLERP